MTHGNRFALNRTIGAMSGIETRQFALVQRNNLCSAKKKGALTLPVSAPSKMRATVCPTAAAQGPKKSA